MRSRERSRLGRCRGRCPEAACDARPQLPAGRAHSDPGAHTAGQAGAIPNPRAPRQFAWAAGALLEKTSDEPKGGSGLGRAVLGHSLPEG